MVSLYKASIPMMMKSLENLKVILTKAEQHFEAQGRPAEEVIKFRLIEDMRGLDYQVQNCSDTAKGLAHRVGGHEKVAFADEEKTFSELRNRIDRTLDILRELPENSMDGKEDTEIVMKTNKMGDFYFTGYTYTIKYAVPNFLFHMTTAYCILRHLGAPIGAFDYLDTQKDLFVRGK